MTGEIETTMVCDGEHCGGSAFHIIQKHDPAQGENHENDTYRLRCAVCGLPVDGKVTVNIRSMYTVELRYATQVKGINSDDAISGARKRMAQYAGSAFVVACEECEEKDGTDN